MRRREMTRPRLYVAAPLFNEAERSFNLTIRGALVNYMDVYLPQEQVGLVADLAVGGTWNEAVRHVFRQDLAAIRDMDALLIVLDGRSVDEGAAFELGFAFALGKICIGLQTDSRRAHPWGNNPMVDQAAQPVFRCLAELTEWAKRWSTREKEDRCDRNKALATSEAAPLQWIARDSTFG